MNRNHLPAGQGMPPDMGRRRQYHGGGGNHHHGGGNHHHNHMHNYHPHHAQHYPPPPQAMYNGYVMPYNTANYYPQHMPPQYPMPNMQPPYNPYQHYGRTPPPPPPAVPPPPYVHAPVPQHPFPRHQASPALVTSYQPPPPQTPTSTQSSQTASGALTPPTPQAHAEPTIASTTPSSLSTAAFNFQPPLPWLSRPEEDWPTRKPRRRKRMATQTFSDQSVELPSQPGVTALPLEQSQNSPSLPRPETPDTTRPPSDEAPSTNPTTPASTQQSRPAIDDSVTPKASSRARPVVPVVPVVRRPGSRDHTASASEVASSNTDQSARTENSNPQAAVENTTVPTIEETPAVAPDKPASKPVKAWATPKSWTGIFSKPASTQTVRPATNGKIPVDADSKPAAESLAETLRTFNAEARESKVSFLEPRGLVNSGNMCYMNSVLQVLMFCSPFYDFLDVVSKRAAHSFKSETPLIDAMIMIMREYQVIDSAKSVDQLRMRLKDGELEQYGEPFTPDYVYEVMRKLPRFVNMQRGHQQDAEEFLGFLLEGLHEECVHIMHAGASNGTSAMATPVNEASSPNSEFASPAPSAMFDGDWHQVGPKQRAAVTRSSGSITISSPITRIFGGNLRSELRVPGLKDSVTLEPYQPLQLDIGAPNVNNIIDALKALTRSEALHGDFHSPKGPNVTAMKQVFIESVPPVLILHLKRFQYNNSGGTQKIWKNVGYPLELDLPREVFARTKRAVYTHDGSARYRLIAVVYHHGKNASGGHYTVDVRRQDGREWIRLDDTFIRRIKTEDVAEGGNEEDVKGLAAAAEAHRGEERPLSNMFSSFADGKGEATDEAGWKQATGTGKKWSSVVNGTSTPKSQMEKFSVMDNKVAYLLFYQRM